MYINDVAVAVIKDNVIKCRVILASDTVFRVIIIISIIMLSMREFIFSKTCYFTVGG